MSQEATIRRGVRNARYAAIPNHVFEDMRLSMEARWLLGYLLSKPDNWTVVQKDIANKGGCGRDKARKMIAELVDAGYAEKEQARDSGRFGGMSLVIYDEPLNSTPVLQPDAGSVAFLPQTEIPSTVNPSTETPSTVNQALVITNNLENTDYRSERGARDCESKRNQSEALLPEDNPKSAAFEKRVMRLCTGKGFFSGEWSDWSVGASFSWICDRFAELTANERLEAEKWRDAYLLNATSRKKAPQAIGNFFKGRVWTGLDPALLSELEKAKATSAAPDGVVGDRVKAPAFGNMWAANVYQKLWAGATRQQALTDVEKKLVENGRFSAEHIHLENQTKRGFPDVNELFERASAFRGVLVSSELKPVSDLMVAVKVDGDIWHELREEHAKRGWPWFPKPGQQKFIWLPNGITALNDMQELVQGLDK